MKVCYKCNANPNFICRDSNETIFSCGYHNNHPKFKFFYSDNLQENLEKTIQRLESFNNEIDTKLEELTKTVNNLISSLNNQLGNATFILLKSKDDIESTINALRSMKPYEELEYLSVYKILVDLNLPIIESTLLCDIKSFDICKVFNKHIKVKSNTENLLKKESLFYFDEDFFNFEIKKAESKENGIQCWEKSLKKTQNYFNIFTTHNSKRMLQFINLSPNIINNNDLEILLKIAEFSSNTFSVIITELDVTDEYYLKSIKILEALEYIGSLSVVESISGNERLKIFCDAMRNKRVVKNIVLQNNTITANELPSVLDSFNKYSHKIRSINLDENFFSFEGAKVLNFYLPRFRRLRELSIANNDIGTEGALVLMENLSLLKELEELNTRSNGLKAQGIENIMKGIFMLPHLSVLYLCDNNGFDEGAIIISNYLKYLKMLTVLFVDNTITEDAEKMLLACSNPYTKIMKWVDKNTSIVIKRPVFRDLDKIN